MDQSEYDHNKPSALSQQACEDAVGCTATLSLTGRIIEAGSSDAGPYVRFKLDERWGFGDFTLRIDLDALTLD